MRQKFGCRLSVEKVELSVASCQLSDFELPVAGCRLSGIFGNTRYERYTRYKVWRSCQLPVVGCRGFPETRDIYDIRGTIYEGRGSIYEGRTIRCTMYEGFLLLSTVYCILPPAYQPIPTTYYHLFFSQLNLFPFFESNRKTKTDGTLDWNIVECTTCCGGFLRLNMAGK